jgi:DNA-binding transcriptional MocR family regulator
MPEGLDSIELYQEALKHGIGITPGAVFSASGRYSNCIRINCGLPWTRDVELGIERLGELARTLTVSANKLDAQGRKR